MRRIRYAVAMGLDGYIAGPDGESDWIIMDPEIDFEALFGSFDTILMGRRTFEVAGGEGLMAVMPVLLGGGVPLLPPPAGRASLRLVGSRAYKAGIVSLEYAVER